jgi:DNA-3-methyladenine glycosylase II
MWFDARNEKSTWADAARHLCAKDPVLGAVIGRVGPCEMARRRDYFVALCRAIFAQQLNIRVAQVLFDRFRALLPGRRLSPLAVLEILKDPNAYRGCGLSRQKAAYLKDLARHFADNRIPTRKLAAMSDDQIIESLVAVKGVGRWTAEMFLMFVLNRPDVLPVDDLGLREGFRDIYGLKDRPTAAELTQFAERWRPYRSVATWYVWRRNSNIPVAKTTKEPKAARPARAATRRRPPAVRKKS